MIGLPVPGRSNHRAFFPVNFSPFFFLCSAFCLSEISKEGLETAKAEEGKFGGKSMREENKLGKKKGTKSIRSLGISQATHNAGRDLRLSQRSRCSNQRLTIDGP